MPNKIKVEQVKNGFQIALSADDELAKIDPEKIQTFLASRLACSKRNRCQSKDRTLAERLDCVQTLADRRLAGIGQTDLRSPVRVAVANTDKGLNITITGAQMQSLKQAFASPAVEESLNAIRACRKANRCGAADQRAAEKWQCVSTLGARRFTNL